MKVYQKTVKTLTNRCWRWTLFHFKRDEQARPVTRHHSTKALISSKSEFAHETSNRCVDIRMKSLTVSYLVSRWSWSVEYFHDNLFIRFKLLFWMTCSFLRWVFAVVCHTGQPYIMIGRIMHRNRRFLLRWDSFDLFANSGYRDFCSVSYIDIFQKLYQYSWED